MGIEDELKRQGYELEYESSDGEGHKQVWVNEKAGMAVRIEWMRVERDSTAAVPHAATHGHGERKEAEGQRHVTGRRRHPNREGGATGR